MQKKSLPACLRLVFVGGEKVPAESLRCWRALASDRHHLDKYLWSDGSDDYDDDVLLVRRECRSSRCPDWAADRQHSGLCFGQESRACSGWD